MKKFIAIMMWLLVVFIEAVCLVVVMGLAIPNILTAHVMFWTYITTAIGVLTLIMLNTKLILKIFKL